MFANEADGEDGDFFDGGVIASDVAGDLFDDARPLVARYFYAANGCDSLNILVYTLAAALRMFLSRSIMELRTRSLQVVRLPAPTEYHRYDSPI